MNSLSTPSRRVLWGSCALTALLWWGAGQRWGVFALGWVALSPLLWSVAVLPARARWRWGWLGGALSFVGLNWWIAPTLARASPAIGLSSSVGLLLGIASLVIIGTGYGAAVALLCVFWSPSECEKRGVGWLAPCIFALGWWVFDWVRCTGPVAHSWGALAFTQWRDVPLLQTAALVGQHGLSALCAWLAANVALWLRRGAPSLLWPPVIVLLALHGWGIGRVALGTSSRSLRVMLVQTNVPSLRKSGVLEGETPFARAYRVTRPALDDAETRGERPDVVLWPETTINVVKTRETDLAVTEGAEGIEARCVRDLARIYRLRMVVGAQARTPEGQLFNQAIEFLPDGTQRAASKEHLVPFGERAPWGEAMPFLQQLAPSPPITPGSKASDPPALICFESCFPQPANTIARRGAPCLWVLTNDEWYGGTTAPWEHACMAMTRAVEAGVPIAQVANGGYSFVVDRFGRCALNSGHFTLFSRYGETRAYEATLPL